MKNKKLNDLVKISLLGVMGFIIMFLEFPIPFLPPYLKIDFSDLPALIGTFALGPVAGVMAELIKNLLHGLYGSSSMFIGELANFTVGSIMCIISGLVYKRKKTRGFAILGLSLGTIAMTIGAVLFNYYIFLPLYGIKDAFPALLYGIIPFNLIKGVLVSVLTFLMYKSVSPILHKEISKREKVAQNKI